MSSAAKWAGFVNQTFTHGVEHRTGTVRTFGRQLGSSCGSISFRRQEGFPFGKLRGEAGKFKAAALRPALTESFNGTAFKVAIHRADFLQRPAGVRL